MTTQPLRRKLIEVALPLEAINAASAREKSIRHGHPSTLHLWWARRPLATARAILFAQLVDDPNDAGAPAEFVQACRELTILTRGNDKDHPRVPGRPGTFATAEDTPRNRLFDFIAELVEWENTTNQPVLEQANRLIRLSTGGTPPPVLDPFSGGCTIPLEAQRLGLEAHGSDLNPVAVMIGKASIEIPPRFAGRPAVHTRMKGSTFHGAQGLAADVRHYGAWMKAEAEARIGHLYPKARLPDGKEATVIAWLWARTVASPDPAAGGAHVPLVRSFALSTKKGKERYVEPVVDGNTYRFVVRHGKLPDHLQEGTVGRTGARCILTGTPFPLTYIRAEGKAGRMGTRLMAIVAEGNRQRAYLDPTEEMEQAAASAEPQWKPEQPLGNDPRAITAPNYGMTTFGDLFTPRQLVALTTFSDLVAEARERVKADALAAGMPEGQPLREGGNGALAYAEAVGVYLGLVVSRTTERNNNMGTWDASPSKEQVRGIFARQAISMNWDTAEGNFFASSSGTIGPSIDWVAKVVEMLPATVAGSERQLDAAARLVPPKAVISTDPPYYDNIGYADLSDFFYVWLRRSLRSTYPDLFGTMGVPKREELVANPFRQGGKDASEQFFLKGMTQAMHNMATQGNQEYPTAIYYAFKQAETTGSGVSSTGWATFLEAVIQAGYSINGTWPVRSELSNRMRGQGSNALATSIVMVCRPRPQDAPLTTRTDFLRELRRSLPTALSALTASNLLPVDMAQASIGPGMAVYSRYRDVLESDGSRMPVRVALQLINAALDEYLAEQEGHLDSDTRFAVTWFETHGLEEAAYGDAETLATARGVSVAGVAEAGLILSRAGKVRLKRRDELAAGWNPQADKRPTAWEAVQHLARINDQEGADAAGRLMAQLQASASGDLADSARQLAYRLYGICERKGWSSEGQVYNALVASWGQAAEAAARAEAETADARMETLLEQMGRN
ncbi:DUF1156 domain-containing protein [Deinococcus budaensis]|uniref:Putative DNA methylase n=1 Tax=Deinococcus budaensis TaxID=1665626 RepID=A0A7W8LNX7_9DEIO|nr:DUF1156 domain-containing protein [Deinococcus budaensis]MBB5233181.1 putative DNA methylase [Deinococcus budaensis]